MSKIKDLKEKNPNYVIDLIDDLAKQDPSKSNKYLPFMVDACAEHVREYFNSGEYLTESFVQLLDLVKGFEKYCNLNLIENKDIYSYPSIVEIETAVREAKAKNTNKEIKINETIVLYEDADKILVKCLTKASAELYGRNTKWCTSAKRNNRYSEYASHGVLLYFTYKHPPKGLPAEWVKLAFNQKTLTDVKQVWNAKSEVVSTFDAMRLFSYVGQDVMEIVVKECDLCIPNTAIKRREDGTYEVSRDLFEKEGFAERKKAILEYMATVTDKRDKNKSAIDSLPTEPEKDDIEGIGYGNELEDIDPPMEEIIETTDPVQEGGEATPTDGRAGNFGVCNAFDGQHKISGTERDLLSTLYVDDNVTKDSEPERSFGEKVINLYTSRKSAEAKTFAEKFLREAKKPRPNL